MNNNEFHERLARGQIGESLIARFLRRRNWILFPAYEKEINNGKGPRLFLPFGFDEKQLILPDIQGMNTLSQLVYWFDVKHKSACTYYRKNKRWQTGIDLRHYQDYLKVQKFTKWPVWLLFLQREATITNAPPGVKPCPTGLYGCPITQPYSDDGWHWSYGKRCDMVYWGIDDLKFMAPLQAVLDETNDAECQFESHLGCAPEQGRLPRPSGHKRSYTKKVKGLFDTTKQFHDEVYRQQLSLIHI